VQNRNTFSEEQSSAGVGDITLVTQYGKTFKNDLDIRLSVGLKVPTGNISHQSDRGVFLSPDMQSGSGTVDVISRFSLSKSHFAIRNMLLQFGVLYRRNSTNNNFGAIDNVGGRVFKFGDEFQTDINLSYQSLIGSTFFTPYINLKYRRSQANEEQNIIAPNSGGQWLSSTLGFSFTPDDRLGFNLYGELPFYQDLTGLQITTDYEIGIGVNYKLNL